MRVAGQICAALALASFGLGAEPGRGTLRVRVLDAEGQLTSARAWVDDAAGTRHHTPTAPETCTPYPRDRSFSFDGWFELTAPAGRVVVHVERGKEFLPVDRPVELAAGERRELEITLARWVDLPARGYYSADLHVHFGHDQPSVLRQLSRADDVHLVPVFTYWLRGTEPGWKTDWPEWTEGPDLPVDATHVVTRTNLEIERISQRELAGGAQGASFLFQLEQPVSVPYFDARHPTDAALARAARAAHPAVVIDTDKPSWADNAVGAALGVYDVVQVCHNHYHRLETLPGGWGMMGPLAPDERDLREPDELFHRTNTQYYHWLNCGIRLGVSGGSAMGVMPVPLGFSRTYAQVEGAFTPENFWAAVKAGRTFATTGPMLTLAVNGRGLGSVLNIAARPPGSMGSPAGAAPRLEIEAHLQSLETATTVELVENGIVILRETVTRPSGSPPVDRTFRWEREPQRSGWYAARALFHAPDGRLRQAHTSPVYVVVDGKPTAFRESAEYMIRWIDRLDEIAQTPGRYRTAADRDEVLALHAEARAFYARTAAAAREHWDD